MLFEMSKPVDTKTNHWHDGKIVIYMGKMIMFIFSGIKKILTKLTNLHLGHGETKILSSGDGYLLLL